MTRPKLAICNFMPDVEDLKRAALTHGFSGVDWTFRLENLPGNGLEESRLISRILHLQPLEVRYHCAFKGMELGDDEPDRADAARDAFRQACRLVARAGGRFMTVHVGLGRDSSDGLSWERSVRALADLVSFAERLGLCVCLENLASGWSSRPELFEKLVRKSNAGVTLDIGHAHASPSVQSHQYAFEDFVSPHYDRVFNAHVYHEEVGEEHTAPKKLEDVWDRLHLLSHLPCDWWALELREESALLSTLKVVRDFLNAMPNERSDAFRGMILERRGARPGPRKG